MPHPYPAATRRRPLLLVLVAGAALGSVAAVGGEAIRVLVGRNGHEVIAGRVYRCAQPSPAALDALVRRYGIRTVVNLRGCCSSFDWYRHEARTTHRLGLSQEDICLSAHRLPSATEVRRLVEVLDQAPGPLLLHCRRGADRTGLASAICLLLAGADLAEARRQLGPRYGHLAVGKPACLGRFLDQYESWLGAGGQAHSADAFRRWLAEGYDGGGRYRVEPLDLPAVVTRGEPWAVRLRFHNDSTRAWPLRAGRNVGVHAAYLLTDDQGVCVARGWAGMRDGLVAPGDALDVTVDLPAVGQPGVHYLTVDLEDAGNGSFYQAGAEPLCHQVIIAAGGTP